MPEVDCTISYRDIEGFPGYKVGNDGSVWSCRGTEHHWRLLKMSPKSGYPAVNLMCNGNGICRHVHRIVLETFIGPCPPGMEACHDPDPCRTNCEIRNLRWDTRKNNHADKIRHGTQQIGDKNGKHKLTIEQVREIRRRHDSGESGVSIAREFGIGETTVSGIHRRRTWKWVDQ